LYLHEQSFNSVSDIYIRSCSRINILELAYLYCMHVLSVDIRCVNILTHLIVIVFRPITTTFQVICRDDSYLL